MSTVAEFPDNLPWQTQHAVLFIDGLTVANLQQRLFDLNPHAPQVALYAFTRFEAISDVSPWLVVIDGADDPVFRLFVAHAAEEWGVLLFSEKPWFDIVTHLRQLLTVQLPEGPEVMLRLSDPPVAHALFAMQNRDERLFGPIDTLLLPDCVTGSWHRHQRCASDGPELPKKYCLSQHQNAALDRADLRRALLKLDAHLLACFPDRYASSALQQRWPALSEHVELAYAQGFTSQSDLTYYVNVFAWLGDSPLESHPDIARLLDTPSTQTPNARVAAAARLARAWAQSRSGTEPHA